jgi:hypothetical protein
VLAFVSSVGDLASVLPCWEWFSFVLGSRGVLVGSRWLLGEQLVTVWNSRGLFVFGGFSR